MPNIVHRISIEGTAPEKVYRALVTRDEIASSWACDPAQTPALIKETT